MKVKAYLGHFHPLNPWPLGNLCEGKCQKVCSRAGWNFHLLRAKFSQDTGYPMIFWTIYHQFDILNEENHLSCWWRNSVIIPYYENTLACPKLFRVNPMGPYLWNDSTQVWWFHMSWKRCIITLSQVGLSLWQWPHHGANIITMWSPLNVGQFQNLI